MIAWVDLETTGLSLKCSIIELACIITDNNFKEVDSYETLIRPPLGCWIEKGAYDMHVKSGLWSLAKKAPPGGIHRVEKEFSSFLDFFYTEKMVLAGFSVHFDRGFIEKWLPKSASYLHYRNFDVSSSLFITLTVSLLKNYLLVKANPSIELWTTLEPQSMLQNGSKNTCNS